jgi:hypothetical protein
LKVAAAPYAVDEQMRVEALRAAVNFCAGHPDAYFAPGVCDVARIFEAYLLDEQASPNAALEGAD